MQIQSNWIRNKHQSLTKSNENAIFTILTPNTGYHTLCENSRKTVAKGSFYQMQPIEKLLGWFLLCLVKNTLVLVISPPSTGRSRSSHLSLSLSLTRDLCMTFYILSVTL
jgi:hypothetical protein